MLTNRVFTCQGSIQLVAALAAADHERRPRESFHDYLVIHNLFAPHSQHFEFANAIEMMARELRQWTKVIYLEPEEVEKWVAPTPPWSWDESLRTIRSRLGIDCVDEMYLNRVATTGHRLMVCCYPKAKRICYGDGIGATFSPRYFVAPQKRKLTFRDITRAARAILGKGRRFLRIPRFWPHNPGLIPPIEWSDDRFDTYRLLLPGIFDEPTPKNCQINRKESYRELFSKLARLLESQLPAESLTRLLTTVTDASSIVLMLPSFFSESGRMSLQDEVAGYCEILDGIPKSDNALVIIKPHPRDSKEKIAELKRAVEKHAQRVLVLDDPLLFYFPFESVLGLLVNHFPDVTRNMKAISFSSSCLSLRHVYDIECTIGYGAERVDRLFDPKWVQQRKLHEHDLRNAVNAPVEPAQSFAGAT